MEQIETAIPCRGAEGEYDVWLQYLQARGRIALARLALPGRTSILERDLGMPDIPDPWTLLERASRVPEQDRFLQSIGAPAITTVVRRCYLPKHADGVQKNGSDPRLEAVSRSIWVPEHTTAEKAAVRAASVYLNENNVGGAITVSRRTEVLIPLICAPLTIAERERMHRHGRKIAVVRALPSLNAATTVYALQHHTPAGLPIERIHTINVNHALPIPLQRLVNIA